MSLFRASDISAISSTTKDARSARMEARREFAYGESARKIRKAIGNLRMGDSIFYMTDGAWSNIQLLSAILAITGPAAVCFTTWSISAEALTRFGNWQQTGEITRLHAILDQGIRNRKPEIYQQATAALPRLRVLKCHAKVTVVSNADWSVTIIGSANYTRNPRKEAGVIACDLEIGRANQEWILNEFENGE